MKVIIAPGKSGNILAAVAIGEDLLKAWTQFALPGWKKYCRRHDLGLIVFDDHLISPDDPAWKKPTWQKMLIGVTLEQSGLPVRNVCFLDVDILINPTAPNVFDFYDEETIGLTSQRTNLPYPRDQMLRRLAFLRHTHYDRSYPLDSALFISVEELYQFHGLTPQADEACAGFICFNVANHARLMRGWFMKYDRKLSSITGGGEQTHFNYEAQKWGKVAWMDYRFQALWVFEMAWKYPFLYDRGRASKSLIRACIEASMFTNYFLHFAGAWHESQMWRQVPVLRSRASQQIFEEYDQYARMSLTGNPVGAVKPSAA